MMPVARFEMPDGKIARFEVAEGTTPEQAQTQIAQMVSQQGIQQVAEQPSQVPLDVPRGTSPVPQSIGQRIIESEAGKPGGEEALGTILSGVAAEPAAGLVGLATLPFADAEKATENIEAVRKALTFIPRSPEGLAKLQQIGEILAPAGEALETLEAGAGEFAGGEESPLAASLATAAPTAALSALGLGGVRRALGISKIAETAKKLTTQSAKNLLKSAAPTIDGLKEAARGIYNELDSLGITINPRSINRLSNQLKALAKKEGFNKRIHPKVSAVLDEFENVRNSPQTLTEVDTLRKIARGAASSIEPSEARLGAILIEHIDDTLDNLKNANFANPSKVDIGAKFKDARQLWSRAKKSELLEEAFTKASLQASGFENGIRVQFRSILNNKKKRRGFTPEELSTMRQVVKGGTAENIAKMIGRFGFSEGQASNMLMGSLGVAGGAVLGGPAGAVAVPLIGQLSRTLAQKLTRRGAEGADAIVKAGKDGKKVVDAYIKATKKSERNAQELTELLLRPEISLKALKAKIPNLPKPQRKLVADAVFFAAFIQSQKQQTQETER